MSVDNQFAPAISVIMPVYNSEAYLREAIESVLNQSFTDFEFLIFNDGSTDNSADIILSYNDERIIYYGSSVNVGYTPLLNKGLKKARGRYIARMDSDDIALPDRFEKQFNFLEKNRDIAVCGGFFEFTGTELSNKPFNWVSETDPEFIKINLLFDCAICHPTVMLRAEELAKSSLYYNEALEPSEDYDFWIRISNSKRLANIPDVILKYRLNSNQVSNKKNHQQLTNKANFITSQLKALGINPTKLELRLHDYLFFCSAVPVYDYLPKLDTWIKKLKAANNCANAYDEAKFNTYLDDLYKRNKIDLSNKIKQLTFKENLIFLVKCLLKWRSLR
ncbi:glycosyltransferase [Mucilaginibacter pallidiroseus]|uniref:Glycosyltransferase n=1 Tax=Mucilaginibacter pallidiroseus TaxID=2599295 RepID=A0A563U0N2_9SPHI|nr:glycosyltransferase family 2 protein [Mucilaginibacter pallidiroseus]TWR25188.1 glycosyltransferase [Mucilaginibacter pallidiroseus]